MLNRNSQTNIDCTKTKVGCVKWDKASIPCLGIEKGDYLDEVVFALVNKICEREDEFDLETITLSELVERLNITEPGERTVHTLLQLCIDNDVKLHQLFTQLRDAIPGATGGFNLDLKCFKQLDSYGNQIPYDEQTVLQQLLNEACAIRGEFEDFKEEMGYIDGGGGTVTLPFISGVGCLPNASLPNFVKKHAEEFCKTQGKLGENDQLNIAIGRQDSQWSTIFVTNNNFVPHPTTVAESISNQWMSINNLQTRVEHIEDCACRVTCKDLEIGFGVIESTGGLVLEFTPQYGNSVHEDFSLTGNNNKVSFTDKNGKRMTFNIASLANEDSAGPFDVSKLAQDGEININVCVAFTTSKGDFCNKCVSDIYNPATSSCNFCEIVATGDVTILYKNCTTDEFGSSVCTPRALRLSAGDEAAIRKSYQVSYISDPGNLTGMECLNFGNYETVSCYIAPISSESNKSREIIGIKYKGSEYTFSKPYIRVNSNGTPNENGCYQVDDLVGEIVSKIPIILKGNGRCVTTTVTYKRVVTSAAFYVLGWGMFTKKVATEHKFSAIQILTTEEVAKSLQLMCRTPEQNDDYSYFYVPFAPRENFEGYGDQDSILPPSLCS